jgi:hypothetical protein
MERKRKKPSYRDHSSPDSSASPLEASRMTSAQGKSQKSIFKSIPETKAAFSRRQLAIEVKERKEPP